MTRFIIDRSKKGEFLYNLVDGNGKVILSGQGYGSKQGCKVGINSVQNNAPSDERYDIKKNRKGQVFFNLMSHNGRIIGSSSLYSNEKELEKDIQLLKKKAKVARIQDVTRGER